MLRYDTPADAPDNRPVRKLLVMVLLMSIRDRASTIRFCLQADRIDTTYQIDGEWYELVPPPAHIWPDLVADVRSVARLIRPDRGGWFYQIRFDDPEAGWLTFRVVGQDQCYLVRLGADELRLERFGGYVSSETAIACLVELHPP